MNRTQVDNPGPGTYAPNSEKNTKYTSNPAYGVGTAKRSDMANSASKANPGPGNYTTPSKAVEGPKFIMGGKYDVGGIFMHNLNPGPGTHEPDAKRTQ